jgi:hypothetical protein
MVWMGRKGSNVGRLCCGNARRSRCCRSKMMVALCLLFVFSTLPTSNSCHSASFDRRFSQRSLVAFQVPVNGGLRRTLNTNLPQHSSISPARTNTGATVPDDIATWRRHKNHSIRQCPSRLFFAASSPVPTDSSSSKSESPSAPNANTELTKETNVYCSSSAVSTSIVWDDEITSGLQRAKQVLEKSKAKLAARQEQASATVTTLSSSEKAATSNNDDNVPFFAQLRPVEVPVASFSSSSTQLTPTTTVATVASSDTRQGLVKTLNAATGLITIDGEKLAARSEQEQWEFRSLAQVFREETSDTDAATSVEPQPARMAASSARSEPLADRDVLASIYNLRLQLQKEDYHRIFDAKNRFIGEDN